MVSHFLYERELDNVFIRTPSANHDNPGKTDPVAASSAIDYTKTNMLKAPLTHLSQEGRHGRSSLTLSLYHQHNIAQRETGHPGSEDSAIAFATRRP